jgi:hypothetical protein
MYGFFSLGFRDGWNVGFEQEICCSGKEPLNQKGIVLPLVRQLPWSHHFITQKKRSAAQKKAVKKEANSLANLRNSRWSRRSFCTCSSFR